MKHLKKSPRQQLEKFSTIFMQLGLVLVMFVVFISLEHETEQSAVLIERPFDDTTRNFTFDKPVIYVKQIVKAPEIIQQKPSVTIIHKPEVIDNDTPDDVIFVPVEDLDPPVVVVVEAPEPEIIDIIDEPKPTRMDFVSKIPVFAGCEDLSEKEGRKCFDKKMNKLIKRHFNTGLANELGLRSGKNKILTQFVIDKTGKVTDVKIRAPHARLTRETLRIVNKIPHFTPGENNGSPVSVRYTLPINFLVE